MGKEISNHKIVFFCSTFGVGIPALFFEQAINFRKYISDFSFIFISGDKEQHLGLINKCKSEFGENFKIIPDLDFHSSLVFKIRKIKSIINEFNPDYVHVQNNWQLVIVYLVKVFSKCKFEIIYTIHSFRNNRNFFIRVVFKFIIEIALLCLADKIIYATEFVKKSFPLIQYKMTKLVFGVDSVYYNSMKGNKILKNEINAIYAAKFREGKDQEKIIRLIASYNKTNNNNKINLILPGDGDKLNLCVKLADDLKVSKYVSFPGFLNVLEMSKLYQKAHIAIIASKSETFGHCIVEPIIMDCLVISTHVGVANDIIINGKNGFLYNMVDEISDIIDYLFFNPEKYFDMVSEASKLKSEFNWESIAIEYRKSLLNYQ